MRTTKNSIVCVNKIEISSGEVDIDLKYDILGKKNCDDAYNDMPGGFNMIDKGDYVDNYPIKISILKKILSKIEKSGCNYVSIDYNCDHPDYILSGIDVHVATEDEISEEDQKELDRKLKEYENTLKRIEKEKEKIDNELKNLRK